MGEIDYQKSLLDSLTEALNILNDIYKQCQQTNVTKEGDGR